ncbi:MAG: magnesium chelatase domain-containing protein [Lachnospiraceae bacterium]
MRGREAQDRVRTALRNSGYALPAEAITVNLVSGDIRKSGTRFDLPDAAAVMASYGYLPQKSLDGILFAGELGLDGSVQGIHGILRHGDRGPSGRLALLV